MLWVEIVCHSDAIIFFLSNLDGINRTLVDIVASPKMSLISCAALLSVLGKRSVVQQMILAGSSGIKAYLQLRMGQPDSWRFWTLWGQQKYQTRTRCWWYLNMLLVIDLIWALSHMDHFISLQKKWAQATWFSGLLAGSRLVSYLSYYELSVSNFLW